MNRYQKELNEVKKNCGCNGVVMIRCSSCTAKECKMFESMNVLQELVDLGTPTKPTSQKIGIGDEGHLAGYEGTEYYCPQCGNTINDENWNPPYCEACGQALDWNELDDFYDEDEGDYD